MIATSRRTALLAVLLSLTCFGAACGHQPDLALHPNAPATTYAPLRHPFRHADLYVDTDTAASRWQRMHDAEWLEPITSRPQARWLNGPLDLTKIPRVVARARARDQLPVFVAYYIPNRGCSNYKQGAPDREAYEAYIRGLVSALGKTRSVIVLEPDAAAADCFDSSRAELLANAVQQLSTAGHAVYLDAGHARWRPSGDMAVRLVRSGINQAEGFAVNVANRQTTDDSYAWGLELSDLVGGREFVIDTSRNGLGPPPDNPNRDDEWCNPHRQALGLAPRPVIDRPGLAALLWIKAPGESDGECGGEHTYEFSASQARNLITATKWLTPTQRNATRSRRRPSNEATG